MPVKVKLDNLVKRFGDTVAINHVSLEINPGELFFLLGPSGCGKTTLLRSIAGFSQLDEGRVYFDDSDITNVPPHKRDTGMVFQSYALWPHMTVSENVAFGLEMRKMSKREISARVGAAIASVRMTERALHKPNQLSGGQQQRVALARALVVQPRCMLLDEPLSNLDAKLRQEMRVEIRRICKEAGLTSVYVTHDQKEALSIADRIAVLRDGKIEQIGTPLEVYRSPVNSFTAGFIGEANFIEGTIAQSSGKIIEIDTALGRLVSSRVGAFMAGSRVKLCIRPESLRFDAAPAGCVNVLKGQLRDSVYLGEVAQHQFVVGDTCLKAFELNPRRVARDEPADAVAWIDAGDVIVLSE